jgi:hypothetical protein
MAAAAAQSTPTRCVQNEARWTREVIVPGLRSKLRKPGVYSKTSSKPMRGPDALTVVK